MTPWQRLPHVRHAAVARPVRISSLVVAMTQSRRASSSAPSEAVSRSRYTFTCCITSSSMVPFQDGYVTTPPCTSAAWGAERPSPPMGAPKDCPAAHSARPAHLAVPPKASLSHARAARRCTLPPGLAMLQHISRSRVENEPARTAAREAPAASCEASGSGSSAQLQPQPWPSHCVLLLLPSSAGYVCSTKPARSRYCWRERSSPSAKASSGARPAVSMRPLTGMPNRCHTRLAPMSRFMASSGAE
mmetsp:Transcript_3104/g.9590  ORF Transcript_3104/g.9590 Transcript_3104/m.9590 type:complete len:246 (+) Transcript_3104:286-1023(+)